ncbi:nucleotidyltransferase domain-containing protein [Stigmatella erecta]|uniref:Cyclic GMP-AMP synthase n=1 Tax=Stigmatella erecta TaxID=83460 RepID=A0A1I0KR86_9BACT|nr:nucleotidyltransferase [Stigmatella erecta]SEU27973.1 hypothetical protein SAMN05443639_11384 [Stigmatella erecta]
MADIQKQFVQFDESIRLKRFEENQMLIEKRDAILDRLRAQFAKRRKEGETIPSFQHLNQGSYQMGTGIQPAQGDYDIDVGLCFNCSTRDYPNPVSLKVLVADALAEHTDLGTRIRRSCVTVYYKLGGEQAYHVDLAVYAYDNPQSRMPQLFLAKGYRDADAKSRSWESSDPKGLCAWVEGRFPDNDQELQFLRVIRALKRWKTEKFKLDGDNAPSGIGLTVAAGKWFSPRVTRDPFTQKTTFNDLEAMRHFVQALVGQFYSVGTKGDGNLLYRLQVPVPVPPGKDIFERMSPGQMTVFRERLTQLQDLLTRVARETDPVDACKLMRKEFCDEFPVPDRNDTGRSGPKAISTSGISA